MFRGYILGEFTFGKGINTFLELEFLMPQGRVPGIFNFDISDEILYMGIIDFRGLKNQFSLKYVISGGARNLKGNTRVPIPRLT